MSIFEWPLTQNNLHLITWFSNTASFSDIDECLAVTNPCENGATCVDNDGSYTCTCLAGYEGPNCQDSKIFIVSASIKLISYIHLIRKDSFKQTVAKLVTVLLKNSKHNCLEEL